LDRRQSPTVRFLSSFSQGRTLQPARRLVEAGVSVVTLKVGDRDTHEKSSRDMRVQLPRLDRGFHAPVCDRHERGLEPDAAVVMSGEFGRAPEIARGDDRDPRPQASAADVPSVRRFVAPRRRRQSCGWIWSIAPTGRRFGATPTRE
jgi:hypothetical protein